jgi:hypothetical protein
VESKNTLTFWGRKSPQKVVFSDEHDSSIINLKKSESTIDFSKIASSDALRAESNLKIKKHSIQIVHEETELKSSKNNGRPPHSDLTGPGPRPPQAYYKKVKDKMKQGECRST